MREPPFKSIFKKAKRGYRGYPVATVAFYGPDDEYATKVAVGIVTEEGAEPTALERWKVEGGDVRFNPTIAEQVAEFIRAHGALSIATTGGIMGCPHEEGIDYPDGEGCRRCPFWATRNRSKGEMAH